MNYQQYLDELLIKYDFPYPLQVIFTKLKRPCIIRNNLLFIDPTFQVDIVSLIHEFIILHMVDQIEIEDDITIRNLAMTDLRDYFAIVSNPHVCIQDASKVVTSLEEAVRKLKYAKICGKGIYIEDTLVGYIGLVRRDDLIYEIGYSLNEKYWNRGITSKAIQIYTDYLLEHTPIHTIQSRVFEENKASQRVLEKAGFIYIGIEKNSLIHPMTNEAKDTMLYRRYE